MPSVWGSSRECVSRAAVPQLSMMSSSVAIANSDVVTYWFNPVLNSSSNSQPTMDYSHGVLTAMCSPFFPQLRKWLGPFLVNKMKLIEAIVDKGLDGNVELVLRPRRCGKTTMLFMLKWLLTYFHTTLYWSLSSRSFFCIPKNDDPQSLFDGLYIASKHDLCQKHRGKYAVIFCDFKVRYSLRTVQAAHLREAEYYWRFLGGNV